MNLAYDASPVAGNLGIADPLTAVADPHDLLAIAVGLNTAAADALREGDRARAAWLARQADRLVLDHADFYGVDIPDPYDTEA